MNANHPTPNDFTNWLKEHLQNSTDESVIDLIPAPCGIGKSASLTVLIAEALQTQIHGIILVTDEVERMHQYVDADSADGLGQYIESNRNRILVYDASNAKAERANLYKKQILIMSTQRFFSLNRSEVIALTSSYVQRRHIFIDEHAPLSENIRVDLATFNNIDTILNQQLDNTAADKHWLVGQWRNLRDRYDAYITGYEESNVRNKMHKWHVDPDRHVTTDDGRFLHLVNETHAAKLRSADNDVHKKIRAVFQMVKAGALFTSYRKPTSKSEDEYSNYFLVTLDHSDLLSGIGSKAIILDGTGTLDPVYDAWYINHVNCDYFKRDLSHLTINIVDINTSRNSILKQADKNAHLKGIVDYVKTLPRVDAVFTYGNGKEEEIANLQTVEREFYRAGFKTGHFGSIKGKNCFRDMTDIVQVGLNRFSSEQYLAMAIQSVVNRYPPDKKHRGWINFNHLAELIMLKLILADIEQNVFRGVIRNVDNEKPQTYTLIYSCKSHRDKNGTETNDLAGLTSMIKERYEAMGATVNVLDTPPTILKSKTNRRKTKDGHRTAAQKITAYLDEKERCPGMPFKLSGMLSECEMTPDQYKSAIRRNPHIKQRLCSIATDVRGWFMFPDATKDKNAS